MNQYLSKILKSVGIAAAGAAAAVILEPSLDWGDTLPWIVGACTVGARVALLLIQVYGGSKSPARMMAERRKLARRAVIAFATVGALALASPAAAQNEASSFSWGPTLPFFTVKFDSTDEAYSGLLNAGAGVSLNWNAFPNDAGTIRKMTIGVPIFMSSGDVDGTSTFGLSTGVTVGTFNNLIAFGVAFDIVKAGTGEAPRGISDGLQREDVTLLFAFGFNLGGGEKASEEWRAKAVNYHDAPPPNYIKLW